jgi:hypothetical protein
MALGFIAAMMAASTVTQIYSGVKQRKLQEKADRIATKRRNIESLRATQMGMEEGRQAIGSVVNVAGQSASGAGGASGFSGAAGSLQTQAANNATWNQQLLSFAEQQESFMRKANLTAWQGQTWSGAFDTMASLDMLKNKKGERFISG